MNRLIMASSPRPKKKSPTIAPMTESPAEMRRPAKIAGPAAGMTLKSDVDRPLEESPRRYDHGLAL